MAKRFFKDWNQFKVFILVVFFIGMFLGNILPQRILFRESVVIAGDELEFSGGAGEAAVNLVAVTPEGQGFVGRALVEIVEGKGRVLFRTNPFVEPDAQYSFESAVREAQRETGLTLADKDVIYSIQGEGPLLIGGSSAGAALSAATVAAMRGASLRDDAVITGSINPFGVIGPVTGVYEKALAAGRHGFKLFLVPPGLSKQVVRQKSVEEGLLGEYFYRRESFVPREVDLVEAMEKEFGMEVVEVSSLEEALDYLAED